VTPEDQASREARESADSGVTETDASPAAAPAEAKSEEAAAAPAEAEVKVAATSEGAAAEEAATAAPVDPELVAKGEKVFRKCKACHQVGDNAKNKTGPLLNGVVGQKVGAVDGFRYSSAMEEAGAGGMVWTVEELHAFLEKPRSHMKGTKMSFSGLKKESDREAVIAYLNSFE
jgi:cytochrome c